MAEILSKKKKKNTTAIYIYIIRREYIRSVCHDVTRGLIVIIIFRNNVKNNFRLYIVTYTQRIGNLPNSKT